MTNQTGLLVHVLRSPGFPDCTLNGVSSKDTQFLLVGEGVNGPFTENKNTPTLELRKRNVGGVIYLSAAPLGETRWVMFGGNFIYCSDSRFAALNGGYPIPVHDRIEG